MTRKRELKREGRREQPALPVPRVARRGPWSAKIKDRPDDEVILNVLGMVEFVLIPKDLHQRVGIRVYFVKDEEGFWHWAHRDRKDAGELSVSGEPYVAPTGLCAFYEHERRLAVFDLERTEDAALRHRLIGKREYYASLIAEELETTAQAI